MQQQKKLNRDIIIRKLVEALKSLDYVKALWEGGAAAFNRVDKWSDIDLYILSDKNKINQTLIEVEKVLSSLSPIIHKYKVLESSYPNTSQTFYRLRDSSDYLIIDLVVLTKKSPEKFIDPEIHGDVLFYFNKTTELELAKINEQDLEIKLEKRLKRLKTKFLMFNCFVQKEINRKNYLEALTLYQRITLLILIEVLRIKYTPFHHDFKIQYISYELPKKMVKKLENLSFISNGKDLQEKYHQATKWIIKLFNL